MDSYDTLRGQKVGPDYTVELFGDIGAYTRAGFKTCIIIAILFQI